MKEERERRKKRRKGDRRKTKSGGDGVYSGPPLVRPPKAVMRVTKSGARSNILI